MLNLKKCSLLLVLMLVLASGAAVAQEKGALADQRVGPPNFRMGGTDGICNSTVTPIPDSGGGSVGTSIEVADNCGGLADLDVLVQITHTWVGDLTVQVSKQGGPSALIIDRPGYVNSGFGCSGDDIDAVLNDEAGSSVEDECGAGVPTIQGEFIPFPDLLAAFDGEDLCGTWDISITDHAGGDTGQLDNWCLICDGCVGGGDGGDGGDGGVPATTGTGVLLMVLALLGTSALFLRRRVTN